MSGEELKTTEKQRAYAKAYYAEKRKDPHWLEAQRKYHREYARKWAQNPDHKGRIQARQKRHYDRQKHDVVWYARERERKRAAYHRRKDGGNQKRWNRMAVCAQFGVTVEWYEQTLLSQSGVCAVCRRPETAVFKGKVRMLAIDHNHSTGAVRGLLCTACNLGVGSMQDSPTLLRAAALYLESHIP